MPDSAWLFPGQGSQRVGMGKALAARFPAAAAAFETADAALGFPLSSIIFDGPEDDLVSTSNQQPALLVTSIAYLRVLAELGRLPDPTCVAGHSLGEYSALVAAGALDLADAVRLVRRRGELMETYGRGGMIAVIGLDMDALTPLCAAVGVEVANLNAPGQVTLSGHDDALELATDRARALGARRVVRLAVNGAFHSSLMEPVKAELGPLIEATTLSQPHVPVIANVDARLLADPADIKRELVEQITASVRWIDVVQQASARGVTDFYEVGPGTVLSGLVKRIAPEADTQTADALLHDVLAS